MDATTSQKLSLYERLGGETGIKRFLNDLFYRHLKNPKISPFLKNVDLDKLKRLALEFFSMGTGGSLKYTGRDMRSAHAHLHLTEENFEDSNSDILITLQENGIDQETIDEVFSILNSLKGEVLGN